MIIINEFGNAMVSVIFVTEHVHNDDSVYLDIIFEIDIYKWKQSKRALTSINESNGEISTIIGAVVIDTHQPTQTEKCCFLQNTAMKIAMKKIIKQRFFKLCLWMYINDYSTYDVENFTV